MKNRIIENWLTNVNEIGYQIPFCQLLISKGYKVIHITRHGSMEQGKDVIAIAPDGVPCCYQLKAGNISLTDWRNIRGELEELVELPISHPSIKKSLSHRSYLVTNGQLAEEVRRGIDDKNKDYEKKGQSSIQTIVKGELLSDFQQYYGDFLPIDIPDLGLFLDLYRESGRDQFNKDKFSILLEKLLLSFSITPKKTSDSLISQAVNGSVLITSYILGSKFNSVNHIAVIDGWIMCLSYIFATIEKFQLKEKYWKQTVELVLYAIESQFQKLIEDLKKRLHFVQGDVLSDVAVYRTRITVLSGYLCSYGIFTKLRGSEKKEEYEFIKQFLDKNTHQLVLLGESMAPLILDIIFFREAVGDKEHATALLTILLNSILTSNKPFVGKGLPDPYHSIEEILRLHLGFIEQIPDETFRNTSYSLKSAIMLMVRKGMRKELESVWRLITYISCSEFIPEKKWEIFRWHNDESGDLQTRFPNSTESWKRIQEETVKNNFSEISKILCKYPEFILLLLTAYPQRLRYILIIYVYNLLDKQ